MRLIDKLRRKAIDYGLYRVEGGQLCIVTYHGVDLIGETKFNSRFYPINLLESNFRFFKKKFHSVSLKDIENKNFDKTKINVHITFDDGYLNNYKYAVPLLERYELHSTIYVTAIHNTENKILWADLLDICPFYLEDSLNVGGVDYKKINGKFPDLCKQIRLDRVGGFQYKSLVEKCIFNSLNKDFRIDKSLEDYWKLIDDKQILEISKTKFVGIGSHGYYHNNLGNLPLEIAIKEVVDSKKFLESVIQKEVCSIAYPDGSYNTELLYKLNDIGFKTQFLFGASDDKYLNVNGVYDREGVYPVASSENEIFYKLINGKSNTRI